MLVYWMMLLLSIQVVMVTVLGVLCVNTTFNTATVAYYTGTTPGSTACFVCDKSSEYELNTAINERVCQRDGTWSRSPTICSMYDIYVMGILRKYNS